MQKWGRRNIPNGSDSEYRHMTKRITSKKTELPDKIAIVLHQRSNSALQTFKAAAYFSERVKALETRHAGMGWGPHCTEIRWNFASCIMNAVGALESFYNETVENLKLVDDLSDLEKKCLFVKFDALLLKRGASKLKRGEGVLQVAKALIVLRNSFVHFHPEWHNDLTVSIELEKLLPKGPARNPFSPPEAPFFPERCVSGEYSDWAVQTTFDLIDHLRKQLCVSNPLPSKKAEWPIPK